MTMAKYNILLVVLFVSSAWTRAEALSDRQNSGDTVLVETPYVFEMINMSDGMPSNQVNDIIEDDKGVMWFATSNGLCAYDGMRVKKVFLDDGKKVRSPALNCIEIDPAKSIWIGAKDGTIYKVDSTSHTSVLSPLNKRSSAKQVRDLLCINDSTIIAIYTEAIFLIHIHSLQFEELFVDGDVNFLKRKFLHSIAEDPLNSNLFWIGARSGYLFCLEIGSKNLSPIILPSGEQSGRVFKHTDGHLYWISNPSRLVKYHPETAEIITIDLPGEQSVFKPGIIRKSENELWVATVHAGLRVLNTKTNTLEFVGSNPKNSMGLPSAEFYKLYTDSHNDLWVGTLNDGVFRYKNQFDNVKIYQPITAKEKSTAAIVDAIKVDDHIIISEYTEDGLVLCDANFKPVVQKPKWFKSLSNVIDFPRQMIRFENKIIVSTAYDLFMCDMSTNEVTSILDFIDKDMEWFYTEEIKMNTEKELVIIGTGSHNLYFSVFFFNPNNWEHEVYSIQSLEDNGKDEAYTIPFFTNIFDATTIDDSTTILAGSSGLCMINRSTKKVKMINDLLNPDNYNITAVKYHDGFLYISSYSNGLSIYDLKSKPWKPVDISKKFDLDVEMVGKFLADEKGNIWVTSHMGVHAIDKYGKLVHSFDSNYGLPNNHLNFRNRQDFTLIDDTYLFFGGRGNAAFIDISEIANSDSHSDIVISEVKINGKTVHADLPRLLNHDQNNLSIYLSAPRSYTSDKLIFEYKEKKEKDWSEAENGIIQFHQMSPGNYDLEIRARSINKQQILGVDRLTFEVKPPWYKTTWFYALMALFISSVVYLIYLSRIRSFKEKNRRQEAFERQLQEVEMKALRSQMNPHFLFNSLNSIKNFITQNKPVEAARHLTTFSKLMRMILSNSKEQLISLEDELEALKIYVKLEAMRFEKAFDFDIKIASEIDATLCYVPPLILQPFVENAIWHGLLHLDKKGSLSIDISKKDTMVCIAITDNGVGRAQAALSKSKSATKHKSFGLEITKNRLDLLDSKHHASSRIDIIDLSDEKGKAKGTQVIIEIPLIKTKTYEA